MKLFTRSNVARSAVFSLAILAVGCAPKGAYQQAAKTTQTLEDTRGQLVADKTQISKTMASLDDLVNKPRGDLKEQYKLFAEDVDKLNSRFTSTRDRVMDMRSNRDAYLAEWSSQTNTIQSAELKERARQRMESAKADFAKLSEAINAVNDTARPFLDDVNDLKRYFGGDLTATGVKSVPDIVTRTHTEADATQAKIDAALVQLNTVNSSIAPTATTQP